MMEKSIACLGDTLTRFIEGQKIVVVLLVGKGIEAGASTGIIIRIT